MKTCLFRSTNLNENTKTHEATPLINLLNISMYYKHFFILVCYINVKKKKLFIQCEWSYTLERKGKKRKKKKRHPKISITHYHRIYKSVKWHKRVQEYRLAKTAWRKNKPNNKEATVHNCLFKYGKYSQMFYCAYYFIKQCFYTQLWSNKDVYATSLVTTVLFHNEKRTEKASLYLLNCTCTTPESTHNAKTVRQHKLSDDWHIPLLQTH